MPGAAGRMPVLQGGALCFTGDRTLCADAGQHCHLWVFRGHKFSLQFALLLKAHLSSQENRSDSTELYHLAQYPIFPYPQALPGQCRMLEQEQAREVSWSWDNFGGEGLGGIWGWRTAHLSWETVANNLTRLCLHHPPPHPLLAHETCTKD